MRSFKRLRLATLILVLAPASTFAELWTSRSTPSRKQQGRSVTIRVLEELLRNRGRTTRRPSTTRSQHRAAFSELIMPVRGVSWDQLRDSFGDPRSGGRSHMGIDIFAPRWTEVVAASAGTLTSIGNGARSGRSLWLLGRDGRSYFYAHLQDWADGIYDGARVSAGEVIGFVGNSGNASSSPTHLHFEARENGRVLNPYPLLAQARTTQGPVYTASRESRSRRGK